jgi:hypothetical protein
VRYAQAIVSEGVQTMRNFMNTTISAAALAAVVFLSPARAEEAPAFIQNTFPEQAVEIESGAKAGKGEAVPLHCQAPPRVAHVAHVARPPAPEPEKPHPNEQGAEIVILAAIRAGNHRPGPIARESGLGATLTYQAIDRMQRADRIEVARDGLISARGEE